MTILDARRLERSTTLISDICIVGAGAAGIALATQLSDTRLDICLLEAGGLKPDFLTQSLYDLESIGYPVRQNHMARARYYGGSCNLWAGRSMRLLEFDMLPRKWISNSGWPISHNELSGFYEKAAEILGLPSSEHFDPKTYADQLSGAERTLYASRALAPTVSLWAKKAKRFGAAYRSSFKRSATTRLVLHANVTQLRLDDAGHAVKSLEAATLDGRQITVKARVFVLAAGGLENARLLLLSRDKQPTGIGNQFDQVGRCFMDHPRAVFGRVRFTPQRRLVLLEGLPLRNGRVQLGVGFSEEMQEREGLLNHYATFESEFSRYSEERYEYVIDLMKILLRRGHAGKRWELGRAKIGKAAGSIYLLTPKELMPHFMYRWYTLARRAIARSDKESTRVVVYFCEQPPEPSSRVRLGPNKDRLGQDQLILDWRIGESVTKSLFRLQDLLGGELARTRLGVLEKGIGEPKFTDASHHMGTTRMSDNPQKGVVDANCKVHGMRNLFIAGSSVFPSTGHANPTLTVVALAVRLAKHLRSRVLG